MIAKSNSVKDSVCDVVVIGGGPGGSTAASLLQEKGWRVVLLEKDCHPRFHIGESLLPMNLPILERLGVLEQVKKIGVTKYGAEFGAAGLADTCQTIYFSNAMDKTVPYAFQVRRSEFDHLLLQNSVTKGVAVYQNCTVTDVTFRPGQTTVLRAKDEYSAEQVWETRFVIDASGRDTLLARKLSLKRKNPKHQSAAIFGHFKDVVRRSGQDAGNISIYWFQHGWCWMIPLRDGVTSVGAVCWPEYLKTRTTEPAEFLWKTLKLCPDVWQRMGNAQLVSEVRATGNYSYQSSAMYGDGYLLVGDAFAFIDPVFSTGVYLAMNSAMLGAEAADAYLRNPKAAKPVLKHFDRQVRRGINTVSWFIYRFTSPAMQQLFMAPRNLFRIEEALISVLAGDVFRKTPIGVPLALFKGLYYMVFAFHFSRAWAAYQRRHYNTKINFTGGTTPQDSS